MNAPQPILPLFLFSMNTQPILPLFLSSLIMDRQWQCWSRKKATNEERGTNEAEQKKRVGARNQTNEANPMNRSLFSRIFLSKAKTSVVS